MTSAFATFLASLFGLGFGSLAIYIGVSWWQNFIPEVEALNFLFLTVFAAMGLLGVCIGLAMMWQAAKKLTVSSEEQKPNQPSFPEFQI